MSFWFFLVCGFFFERGEGVGWEGVWWKWLCGMEMRGFG